MDTDTATSIHLSDRHVAALLALHGWSRDGQGRWVDPAYGATYWVPSEALTICLERVAEGRS